MAEQWIARSIDGIDEPHGRDRTDVGPFCGMSLEDSTGALAGNDFLDLNGCDGGRGRGLFASKLDDVWPLNGHVVYRARMRRSYPHHDQFGMKPSSVGG